MNCIPGARAEGAGFNLSTITGTAITAGGSANGKGAFADLLAAADNLTESARLTVVLYSQFQAAQSDRYLVDIATGDAGGEEILVENLLINSSTFSGGNNFATFDFPVAIPKGVRVSARCQCTTLSESVFVSVIRAVDNEPSLAKITTYGADESDSGGTTVTTASAFVFGAWVEIETALDRDILGFVVQALRNASGWSGGGKVTYEVGVGAAGSEEIIFSGMYTTTNNSEVLSSILTPFNKISIAKGQRVAIRAAGNLGGNAGLNLDYILYGAN